MIHWPFSSFFDVVQAGKFIKITKITIIHNTYARSCHRQTFTRFPLAWCNISNLWLIISSFNWKLRSSSIASCTHVFICICTCEVREKCGNSSSCRNERMQNYWILMKFNSLVHSSFRWYLCSAVHRFHGWKHVNWWCLHDRSHLNLAKKIWSARKLNETRTFQIYLNNFHSWIEFN